MSDSTTSCPYETGIDWAGDVVVDDNVCFTGAELGKSNVGRIFLPTRLSSVRSLPRDTDPISKDIRFR